MKVDTVGLRVASAVLLGALVDQLPGVAHDLLDQFLGRIGEVALLSPGLFQRAFGLAALSVLAATLAGGAPGRGPGVDSAAGPLTLREREVAALVARGLSNRAIAEALSISAKTVANHIDHILTKLIFRSRAQIASWATRNGLADSATA